MLADEDLVRALHRHWEYSGKDEDVAHEIYHNDAVLEFPQSGERFEGVENFREWRRQYPAEVSFHLRRISHREDLVVTEYLISYDGAPWMFTVSIMEFRGERVARERIYIMDGWEPADWRAPWRSERTADPPFPTPGAPGS
ncbi:nuclear transport factor 2 family protein [Nocardioides sp.]|uniref:nuclear transport factor 2 family protein n=1 Tax=Nocardioides sp. TaxID=35761 RepID=UPI002ED3D198